MSLSKPSELIYEIIGSYFSRLYTDPIKTKAITSCVFATSGNYVAQKIMGAKKLNDDTLLAFGLFGLFFGGPVPHYFYKYIPQIVKNPLGILLIERLIYTALFQSLSLYMLSILEGKTHDDSYSNLKKMYLPILMANWKYLTLLQFINIKYVPPMLRVLVVNLIGFLWTIYLANAREKKINNQRPKK